MSKTKKGQKEKPGAGQVRPDEDLVVEQLETDSWKLCVMIVTGTDWYSDEMMSSIVRHISKPGADSKSRRRFHAIAYQDLIKRALQGGADPSSRLSGKAKTGIKIPGSDVIPDLVKSSMNTEEGLNAALMARVIKLYLLNIRQEDLARKQQEQTNETQKERGIAATSGKKDKQAWKASPGGTGNKAKATKGKPGTGAEEEIPMPVKTESEMKKRKEDNGELSYIDDEPSWGPDAYVIFHGVLMTGLFAEMANVGMSVGCLIEYFCDKSEAEDTELEQNEMERRTKLKFNLASYIENNIQAIESSVDNSPLRELGCVRLNSEFERRDPEGNILSGPAFLQSMYDELSDKVYQMLEQRQMHSDYLKCIKQSSLPIYFDKQVTPLGIKKPGELYTELLSPVPNQCCSVEIILEGVVQQVCHTITQILPYSRDSQTSLSVSSQLPLSATLAQSISKIRNKILPLSSTGTDITEKGSVPHIAPTFPVLYEGDEIKERTSLLRPSAVPAPGLDAPRTETDMLKCFKSSSLLKQFPPITKLSKAKTLASFQQLVRNSAVSEDKNCPSIDSGILENCLQLFSLAELLNFAENHTPMTKLFDEPYTGNGDISTLSTSGFFSDWCWREVLPAEVVSQRLQSALSPQYGYSRLWTRYHSQSDTLFVLLHRGTKKTKWAARILTPLGFYHYQKYLSEDINPLVKTITQSNLEMTEKFRNEKDQQKETDQLTTATIPCGEITPVSSQYSLQNENSSGNFDKSSKDRKISGRSPKGARSKESIKTPSITPEKMGAQLEMQQKLLSLTAYEVGDRYFYGSGHTEKLFISDHAFLALERKHFLTSPKRESISMSYSDTSIPLQATIHMIMDNNAINNSSTDGSECPYMVLKPRLPCTYGNYTLLTPSGIRISLSPYGILGGLDLPKDFIEDREIRNFEKEEEDLHVSSRLLSTPEAKSGKPGSKTKKAEEQQALDHQRHMEETREKKKRELEQLRLIKLETYQRRQKYQSLFASTIQGLHIVCQVQVDLSQEVDVCDGSDGNLVVRQSYVSAPSPTQLCDSLRLRPALQEVCRSYTQEGIIIRLLKDSNIEIMWPDGSHAHSVSEEELSKNDKEMIDVSAINSTSSEAINSALAAILRQSPDPDNYKLESRQWLFTDSSGTRHIYSWEEEFISASMEEMQDTAHERLDSEMQLPAISTPTPPIRVLKSAPYGQNLLKSWQRDPVTGEEMETKEDHTLVVTRPDGTRIVQFGDGTRITSMNTRTDQASFILECTGYARVEMTADCRAIITLTSDVEVLMERTGCYTVNDNGIVANFKQRGLTLINDGLGELQLNLADINSNNEDIMNYSYTDKKNSSNIAFAINRELNLYSSPAAHETRKDSTDDGCVKPRIFALKRDGSGWELLHRSSAPGIIDSWKSRAGVLYSTQLLSGSDGSMLHSAVAPIITAEPEVGYLHYLDGNIIPQNLRPQYYFPPELTKHIPRKKPFGSNLGKGLDLKLKDVSVSTTKTAPPRAFWRRQIIEEKPVSTDLQNEVVRAVRKLIEWREKEMREVNSFTPLEFSSESTREECDSLYNKYLAYVEEKDHHVILRYQEATRPLTPPTPPRASSERRKDKAIEDAQEMAAFEENLTALRSKDIPGYFLSPQGLNFIENQIKSKIKNNAPNLDDLTQKLPIAMRTIEEVEGEADRVTDKRRKEDTISKEKDLTPQREESTLDSTYIILPVDKTVGSEATSRANRPENPSPHSSRFISENNTPTSVIINNELDQKTVPDTEHKTVAEPNLIPDYLFYNVAGIPRTAPVKLPKSLRTINTGEENTLHLSMRQPHTASLSMPQAKRFQQGLMLMQEIIDFGTLREGSTYSTSVVLQNIGVNATRFKIKQPSPTTGIIIRYTPQPIAAGMKISFEVEIFAVPLGVTGDRGEGVIEHSLQIVSEINTLSVPIKAVVMTSSSYEIMEKEQGLELNKGIKELDPLAKNRTKTVPDRI